MNTRFTVIVAGTALVLAGCSAPVSIAEATVSLDDKRLGLTLYSCNAEPNVTVVEDADAVTTTVSKSRELPGVSRGCQDGVVLQLDGALGDREVVDASSGEPLAVATSAPLEWPYDRDRVSESEYEAALEAMVDCVMQRDPDVTAWVRQGLDWKTWDFAKDRDENGNMSMPATEPCQKLHLDPLR